jgi:CheY-like chemotaxis protein
VNQGKEVLINNIILVVDDTPGDAYIIATAVERCLQALGIESNYEVVSTNGIQQAQKYAQSNKPVLVITDLFMPVDDFGKFEVRCDEIEFPHGLDLISSLKDRGCRILVTTFFWNYPGFSRYLGYFSSHPYVDGALPKDLFYLVGMLHESISIDDAQNFPPLRILLEVLWTVLKVQPKSDLEIALGHMRFRSLFDEASDWLGFHIDHVLEARNDFIVNNSGENERKKGANRPKYESDDVMDAAEHIFCNPWMPSFVFRSPAGKRPMERGSYRMLMNHIWEGNWSFDIETSSAMAMQIDNFSIKAEKENMKFVYHARFPEQLVVGDFLTPHKPDGVGFAQILLTLGFFSYWCHLPENRSALTSTEIAQLILDRGGVPYKNEGNTKLASVQKQISEDFEYLDYNIRTAIANSQRKRWWRLLTRGLAPAIIDNRRDKSNEYRYWLNGSLVLRGSHKLDRRK